MLFIGGLSGLFTDPKGTLRKIAEAAHRVADSLLPPQHGSESDLRYAGLPSPHSHGIDISQELQATDHSGDGKRKSTSRPSASRAARHKALSAEFNEKVENELGARVVKAIGDDGLELLKTWAPEKPAARAVTYQLLKAMNPSEMKDGLAKLMNYPGQYTDLLAIMRWASQGINSYNPFTAARQILARPPTEEQITTLNQKKVDSGTEALGRSLSGHLIYDHSNCRFLSFETRPDLGVVMAGMDLLRSFFQVFNPERTEFAPPQESVRTKKRDRTLDDVIRDLQKLAQGENALAETDPDKFVGRRLLDREREMVRALSQLVNDLTNKVGDATRGSTFFNHVHESMSVGSDPGGQLFGYFNRLIEEDPSSVSEHIKAALEKLQNPDSKMTRREEDLLYRSLVAESLRRTGISKVIAVDWLTSCLNAYENLPADDALRITYGDPSRLRATIDHLQHHSGDVIPVQQFRAAWGTFPVEAICAEMNTRYLNDNPLFATYLARFKPYFIDAARGWHREIEGSSVPMSLLEKGLDGRRIGLPLGGSATRGNEPQEDGESASESRVPTLRQPDWEQIMRALEFRTYHPDDARFVRALTPHSFKAMVDGVIVAGRRADARDRELARAGIDLAAIGNPNSSITDIGEHLDTADISLLPGRSYVRAEQATLHLPSGRAMTAAEVYDIISDRGIVYTPSRKDAHIMGALAAGLVPETVEAHKHLRALAEQASHFVPANSVRDEIAFAEKLAASPWVSSPLKNGGLPSKNRYVLDATAALLRKTYRFKETFDSMGLGSLQIPTALPEPLVEQGKAYRPYYSGYPSAEPLAQAPLALRGVLKHLESTEVFSIERNAERELHLAPLPLSKKKVSWNVDPNSGVSFSPNIGEVIQILSDLSATHLAAKQIDPLSLKKMKFLFSPEGAAVLTAHRLPLPSADTTALISTLTPHNPRVWLPERLVRKVEALSLDSAPTGGSGFRLSAPIESWIGNSPHFVWKEIEGARTPVLNFTKSDKVGRSMLWIAQLGETTDLYSWLSRKIAPRGWCTLAEIAKLGQRLVAHYNGGNARLGAPISPENFIARLEEITQQSNRGELTT